ncbi:MAG TPA: SRPBCC family protein [Streptosporangiaceae bacterium]|nr:SRPBCC family protein [Streptosporangiaceae bacterium]
MELDHEFTVPVPVDQAWPVLLDLERVAPCVPGAVLDTIDGDEFTGRLKVKLGAMTITYKGLARFVAVDEAAHSVTIEGTGKEARGSGTASATVQAQLYDQGDHTKVTVHTRLNVTGRPAQFGRSILSEVGAKLIARFADALAEELTSPAVPTEETSEETSEGQVAERGPSADGKAEHPDAEATSAEEAAIPRLHAVGGDGRSAVQTARRSEEAIDLLEVAGPSIAKRAIPLAAGLVAVLAVRHMFRRRRGRHHR